MFSYLFYTPSLSAQDIDIKVNILNPVNGCINAVDSPQCNIYKCYSVAQIKLLIANNSQAGTVITQKLPMYGVVKSGSAKLNGNTLSLSCPNSSGVCFTQPNNNTVQWTFQNVIPVCTLEFEIVFDCNKIDSLNNNVLFTQWTGGLTTNENETALLIKEPKIEITGLSATVNTLLSNSVIRNRNFQICLSEGAADGFIFTYVPETDINTVELLFYGSTTDTIRWYPTSSDTSKTFTFAEINLLTAKSYLWEGGSCIRVRERYKAIECLTNTTSETKYTATIICNNQSVANNKSCSNIIYRSSKKSDVKVVEENNILITTLTLTDINGNNITNGLSPCAATNDGFNIVFTATNPTVSSGYAQNANFKSLDTFSASIPLDVSSAWFITTPNTEVHINGTLLSSGLYILNTTGLYFRFTALTTAISPLTDLNDDGVANELPSNSSISITIKGLKLNLNSARLNACNGNIQQAILDGNNTFITYRNMCTSTYQENGTGEENLETAAIAYCMVPQPLLMHKKE